MTNGTVLIILVGLLIGYSVPVIGYEYWTSHQTQNCLVDPYPPGGDILDFTIPQIDKYWDQSDECLA